MYRILQTIFMGKQARALQKLETDNAALIIEQKIREAESGHDAAKRGLATLLVKIESESKALALLNERIADLTERARQALDADREELAREAATLVAQLENERTVRVRTLETSQSKAQRIRLSIESTHRKLIDLRQGLITAQSIEKERQAFKHMKGDATALSAIREGERVLERLIGSDDPVAIVETLEDIDAELNGTATTERLAEAGFGDPLRVSADDVLSRIETSKSKTRQAKA